VGASDHVDRSFDPGHEGAATDLHRLAAVLETPAPLWSPPVSTSATTCARWTTLASLTEVLDRG
jgi:hypothetical protein